MRAADRRAPETGACSFAPPHRPPYTLCMLLPLLAAGTALVLTGVGAFFGARVRARVSPAARRQVLIVSGCITGVAPVVAFLIPYLMLHGTDNSGAILVLYFFMIVGAWIALLGLLGIAGALGSQPPLDR